MTQTRVALVTGANRGIGLEVARQLSRKGFSTILASRNLASGEAAAAQLKAEGLKLPVVALDVTSSSSVSAGVASAAELFGRIDVLVNNAGVCLDNHNSTTFNILDVPIELVNETYNVNVNGPLRMMQAVLPLMKANGYGRVVNMSSAMGQLSDMGTGMPAYRSSKTALNALTKIAALEFEATNIKINAMHPGWVHTEMGGPDAPRTVEEATDTAVFLSELPADGPTGGFFVDRKPLAW